MRFLIASIAWCVLLACAFVLYDRFDLRAPVAFEVLEQIDPLPKTKALIAEEKWVEAEAYLSFFITHEYVAKNPEAVALLHQIQTKREALSYKAEKIFEGSLKGKSDETVGQIAAGVSDLFLLGDLRDLSIETYHHVSGDEVDEVIVAFSALGVAASAATLSTAGGALPLKGSISILKYGKKVNKIPAWLSHELIMLSKNFTKTKEIVPIKQFFTQASDIFTHAGVDGGLKLIARTTDKISYEEAVSFSKRFGKQSGVLSEILADETWALSKNIPSHVSSDAFKHAATYGKAGAKRINALGEKGFLKSLIKPVKTSRVAKVLDKNALVLLGKIPDAIFIALGLVALAVIV